MKNMKTPITYWGGKQQLVPKLLQLIPEHRQYCEPFFGGGALYFAKHPSEIEFINDINGEMVNFYKVLKRKCYELKDEIDCTLHSEFQHRQAGDIYADPLSYDDILRAWAVWMLSKQSIYSILTNSWRVEIERNTARHFQWTKENFTLSYARRLEATSIFSRDALSVIKATDTPTTFFYLDPPYFNSDCGHYKGYSEEDFRNLLDLASRLEGKFLLSSYPSGVLKEYIEKHSWLTIEIEMPRVGGGTKIEVLTLNYSPEKCVQPKIF